MRVSAISLIVNMNACPFQFNRLFMCLYCKDKFLTMPELQHHNNIKHSNIDECTVKKAIVRIGGIQPVKINILNFSCRLCNQELFNFEDLKNHLVGKHKKVIDLKIDGVMPFRVTENTYTCARCDVMCENYRQLAKHMNEHYSDYVCNQCGSGFTTEKHLKIHSLSHQHGSFPCEVCGKVYRTILAKQEHYKIVHLQAKKHRCTLCPGTFKDYYQKQKHLVEVHGKEKFTYKCGFCTKIFLTSSNMRAHERLHVKGDDTYPTETNKEVEPNAKAKPTRIHQIGEQAMNLDDEMKLRKKNDVILLENTKICPFKWQKNLYLCFYCEQQFVDPVALRDHHSTVHLAQTATQIKETLTKLKKYELMKVDITDVGCKLCDDVIPDFATLKNHLLMKHKKNIDPKSSDGILPFRVTRHEFKCAICDSSYADFKSLNHHMNVHFQNFICEQCGTGFMTPERLRTHAFSHETGSIPCDSCDKVFRSTNAKNEHYATVHMQVRRHRCPHCPETFRNYFQRNKHISNIHGVKLKEFKCSLCPKVFTLSGKLGVHIRTVHLKVKRHSCDVCEWKFYSKSELKEHMIRHGGERKYQCGVCKKAYARKYTLTEHMRIHENDRRFICTTCGRSFIQNSTLKHHIKMHHPPMGTLKMSDVIYNSTNS